MARPTFTSKAGITCQRRGGVFRGNDEGAHTLLCGGAGVCYMYSGVRQSAARALILNELRRLHEGVLARYGLLPSQLKE